MPPGTRGGSVIRLTHQGPAPALRYFIAVAAEPASDRAITSFLVSGTDSELPAGHLGDEPQVGGVLEEHLRKLCDTFSVPTTGTLLPGTRPEPGVGGM